MRSPHVVVRFLGNAVHAERRQCTHDDHACADEEVHNAHRAAADERHARPHFAALKDQVLVEERRCGAECTDQDEQQSERLHRESSMHGPQRIKFTRA